MKRERAAGLGVLGLLGGLLVWNLGFMVSRCDELRPYGAGDAAPELVVAPVVAGAPEGRLAALRGKVVLVDFWATWCGPCRETMPAIERLYQRFRADGFEVMSVNVEGRGAGPKALRFAEAFRPPLTFPMFVDHGPAAARFKVDAIPHMVLVDRKGIVRKVHVGGFTSGTEADLAERIEGLLKE